MPHSAYLLIYINNAAYITLEFFFWKSWLKVPSEYQRRYISRLNTKPLNKRALNPGTT